MHRGDSSARTRCAATLAAVCALLTCTLLAVTGRPAIADDSPARAAIARPRIAIIIDDLGYALAAGRRAVHLPGPVACAVLPSTPRGRLLAELAGAEGKEVLLHLPLQPLDQSGPDEPNEILLNMSRGEFARAFAASLASVPNAIGVNNHRGSLLTRHPGHMSWLMEELRAHNGLFFVDSYTTADSVALAVAREAGIPAVRRDVFLDNERSTERVASEFARLKQLARRRGTAVGIGHPYPETLAFLEQALPELRADGIDLVRISDLVHQQSRLAGH